MVRKSIRSFCFLGLMMTLASCHVVRFFWWNYADIHDDRKFPSVGVQTASPAFAFFRDDENLSPKVPASVQGRYSSFDDLLEDSRTVAFLVIRNDTILYEQYRDGYRDDSFIPSFSVVKSVVAALVGIAVEEGTMGSVHDPITKYLPELSNQGYDPITLEHLLNMRSGLKFKESYGSPFAKMPKFYYGRHLKRYVKHVKVQHPPGQEYDYQSINTLLLSLALEKASGMPVNEYLETKMWMPLGMESDATWSVDSKKDMTVKSFCCLNAVARDYARFGRLYLKKGNWNGKQVLPEEWVNTTLNAVNNSRDSEHYPYVYCWRVPEKNVLFAKGVLGQYVYLNFDKNLIIVRLGKGNGPVRWSYLFKEITSQY